MKVRMHTFESLTYFFIENPFSFKISSGVKVRLIVACELSVASGL